MISVRLPNSILFDSVFSLFCFEKYNVIGYRCCEKWKILEAPMSVDVEPVKDSKACEDVEVKNLQKEEEKQSLSYVIEGIRSPTVDHDDQERQKEDQSETKRKEVKVEKPGKYNTKREESKIKVEIHDEAKVEKERSVVTVKGEIKNRV